VSIERIHSSENLLLLDESEYGYNVDRIEKSLLRLTNCQKVNLYSLRKRPRTILNYLIINKIANSASKNFSLFVDFAYSHFLRAESENEVSIQIHNVEYKVSGLNDNYGADYFDWFNLFVRAILLNDESRLRKIMDLDVESLNPENRSYWWVAYQFFKAYQSGHERNVYTYRERAEAYANDGKTFFVGVEESKNILMRETPKLKFIWYPVVELFYLVYFNKEEEFNTYLAKYLESKKQWIISNKENDNSMFWIDFPSLAACAEAHRKGFNITVESDYIPGWVYRGEYT